LRFFSPRTKAGACARTRREEHHTLYVTFFVQSMMFVAGNGSALIAVNTREHPISDAGAPDPLPRAAFIRASGTSAR